MTQVTKDKKATVRDHTNKERKQVRDLLKFHFEVIAIFGLLIGLFQIDFSKLDKSFMTAYITVGLYYVFFTIPSTFLILIFYISEIDITEERIELYYKLIFLEILITIAILPALITPLTSLGYTLTNILVIVNTFSGLVLINVTRYRKRKKLKNNKKQ